MVDEQMTDDLRAVFKDAAGHAPAPDHGLLERVETRYRGRRRRRAAGVTAAAVALAVGATGVLGASLRPGGGDAPRPASKPVPGPLKPSKPGPVVDLRKTAPQAFRTLPKNLPNGREFQGVQVLDDGQVLGVTWSSFEMTDRIWVYDLAKGKARVVTTIKLPRGQKWFANAMAAGDGQVAWTMHRSTDEADPEQIELWTAPLAGGEARRVTSIAPDQSPLQDAVTSELVVAGGEAAWAVPAGVLTVPLAGGKPRVLPGTKGHQIVSWPWIGTPGKGPNGDRAGTVVFKDLRNLRTGERRTATTTPFKGTWTCGLEWCVGGPASGVTYTGPVGQTVQRRDGRDGRALPTDTTGSLLSLMDGKILFNRYIVYGPGRRGPHNYTLYDLRTGRLLDTGVRTLSGGKVPGLLASPGDAVLSLPVKGDGTVLLDLSKVG
ncbi:hypothetical protein [Actinomadura hibisca]|uniref:hypothetical protein n=1 Tax=Actinomadura hibisca TaxID=68565 RepID=UPI0008368DDA|nr:hypothetical protein [Actinomadura hibisca]